MFIGFRKHPQSLILAHFGLVMLYGVSLVNSVPGYDSGLLFIYRKISRSLEATRFGFKLFNRSEIWQAPRQHRCRDACQISKRHDPDNTQPRGFETSRDFVVRHLSE